MEILCAQLAVRISCVLSMSCVILMATTLTAEDRAESGSVIQITSSSSEQVGEKIAVTTLSPGTSSRRVRKKAVSEFPYHLMSQQNKATALSIVDDLSLYRRLPTLELETDRRCYEFFTKHPDMAVSIWRAMEISRVEMTRKSESLFVTDTKDGTSGTVQVLLNTPDNYVVTCHGEFKSPAIKKPIKAIAMMHLKPTFSENGTVTHQLDMYVAFPSPAIGAIARLISPVSNRIADRNFEEISLFVEMMSLAMSRQPGWVEKLANKTNGVQPETTKELLKLTAEIYVEAVKAEQANTDITTTIGSLLPPTQTAAQVDSIAR